MTSSHRIDWIGGRFADGIGTAVIATSAIFIVLGVAAIIEPFMAGFAVTMMVGMLLIAAGLTHIVSIVRRDGGGAVWHVAVGLAYVAGGLYFVTHPVMALVGLTLLLAMMLFVEAGVDLVAYSAQRREAGAPWLLVNAAVTALLGTLIAMHWPSVSAVAVGTILGLNLMTTGLSRLMLGVAARRFA